MNFYLLVPSRVCATAYRVIQLCIGGWAEPSCAGIYFPDVCMNGGYIYVLGNMNLSRENIGTTIITWCKQTLKSQKGWGFLMLDLIRNEVKILSN